MNRSGLHPELTTSFASIRYHTSQNRSGLHPERATSFPSIRYPTSQNRSGFHPELPNTTRPFDTRLPRTVRDFIPNWPYPLPPFDGPHPGTVRDYVPNRPTSLDAGTCGGRVLPSRCRLSPVRTGLGGVPPPIPPAAGCICRIRSVPSPIQKAFTAGGITFSKATPRAFAQGFAFFSLTRWPGLHFAVEGRQKPAAH